MRIPCPLCGTRDLREFSIRGAALRQRPALDADGADWDAFLHLRDNPAGVTDEFWHHLHGCGAWLIVRRQTTSHHILGAWLASEAPPAAVDTTQDGHRLVLATTGKEGAV